MGQRLPNSKHACNAADAAMPLCACQGVRLSSLTPAALLGLSNKRMGIMQHIQISKPAPLVYLTLNP